MGLEHADPLRPAHSPYLRLPAQLLAYALRELGVQAAPKQQCQGAQQDANTRSHLAAAGRGGAEVRGENLPAVSSALVSADAPGLREVGRFQEFASAGAPRSGRFFRGASPGAGPRSCSSGCACSVGCGPGNLVGKGGREGGGGGSPALRPHPPTQLLERAEGLEPLPQAASPRRVPAAALRTGSLA